MTADAERLRAIAAPHATVADQIRALAAAGVARADIARFLGKRYQHVRNVLEGDAASGGYVVGRADLSGVREAPASYRDGDDAALIEPRGRGVYWLRVRPDGSVMLPDEFVEALGATPGRRVYSRLKDGEVTVLGAETAMEHARAIVRRIVPPEVDLVESFLADKRAEVAREEAND
ncbi:MAG TPA: hypothetical protein VMU93_01935 [Caulobacteraceae bacterium]|nr:hypothetical protein [Caulobacteraceae bacterium]